MKIRSISNTSLRNSVVTNNNSTDNIKQSQRLNNSSNVSFNGMTASLIKFWQMIENGGRAAQFTVEDMGGTNFPRTIMGMFAGWKYTHKINLNSLKQEGIREFLTGPTMTFMPAIVLAVLKKTWGETANVHIENTRNLTYLAGKTELTPEKQLDKQSFYKTIAQDMLNSTIGKETPEKEVELLTNALLDYDGALTAKKNKKQVKNLLETAQETFSRIIKRNKDNYNGTDFITVKYTINESAKGATGFKNYANYARAYVNDFNKFATKNSGFDAKALLSKFQTRNISKRVATVVLMVGITGRLMSLIPKIYTKASGNVNPNAKEIYNQADSKNNTPKEAK